MVLVKAIEISCPLCNNKAELRVYKYVAPIGGETLIFTVKCVVCGFKDSDSISLAPEGATCLVIDVVGVEDLNLLLYVPTGSELLIPQYGINVQIDMLRSGEIVTVEALVLHIAEHMERLCRELEKTSEDSCMIKVHALKKLLEGANEEPVTIMILNIHGGLKVLRHADNVKFC